MKRKLLFGGSMLLLACLSGFLLSRASWVGKTGMTLFYREYIFLKTWWKGAAAVAAVWLLFFLIQGVLTRKRDRKQSMMVHIVCILFALIGAALTYKDFTDNLSHRLLGTAFHTGAYLFWAGWIAISIFYLARLQKKQIDYPDNTQTGKAL